jgi:hypothetical protein
MMQKKFFLIVILSALVLLRANSQKQWWYGSFDHICDDREYYSGFATAQTILGARIDAGRGFEIDTFHQVYVGLNYMFEYGSDPTALQPIPDLYYKYEIKHFRMFFGSFPRKDLLNYPLVLLTDTLAYYRPNIQGGLMEFSGDWGYQNAWCDWVSRQTMTDHEAFLSGTSGHIKYGMLYLEDYFYMYHHAGTMAKDTLNEHVRDNGGGAIYLGIDLNGKTFFNKLTFDVGGVGNYDRYRPTPYTNNYGLQFRLSALYKKVGLDATWYKGDKISLAYGEPFYSSGNYARIDAYIKPFKSKHTDSKIGWSFHYVNGNTLDNSFQVFFRADFLNM